MAHISTIKPKTSAVLAAADLDTDRYHQIIKAAARYLMSQGKADYVYCGQWSKGTTWWNSPFGYPLMVANQYWPEELSND